MLGCCCCFAREKPPPTSSHYYYSKSKSSCSAIYFIVAFLSIFFVIEMRGESVCVVLICVLMKPIYTFTKFESFADITMMKYLPSASIWKTITFQTNLVKDKERWIRCQRMALWQKHIPYTVCCIVFWRVLYQLYN